LKLARCACFASLHRRCHRCRSAHLAGNFFSKLAKSHDSGSDTPCDKFAENYKGEDYDSMFFCTRDLSTDFTRRISADVACLEIFQEFSCMTWTEDDFYQIPSESSPVPYDSFLESSVGLMPARKKARSKHKLFLIHSPSLSASFHVLFSQCSLRPSFLR